MKYLPVFLALCLAGCTQGLAEEDSEKLRAMMMTVEALPPSPTNRVADLPAAVQLGRSLFFDTRMSMDGTIACASCHDPNEGWSDPRPLSLGVETAGGVFTPLIARNTTVPTRKSQVFSTAVDNQPMVNIHVLQGERPMAEDNQSLARFEFLGIPPAPRGVPQIEVTFELDANGIVNVSAKDLGSGKVQSIRVTSQSGLTQDEIDRILNEAENQRDEDDQRRELAGLINRAETLLYTTKQSLEAYGEKLESEDIQLIEHDMTELRTALDQNNLDGLEELFKALEVSAYRIAEALYGTSQS